MTYASYVKQEDWEDMHMDFGDIPEEKDRTLEGSPRRERDQQRLSQSSPPESVHERRLAVRAKKLEVARFALAIVRNPLSLILLGLLLTVLVPHLQVAMGFATLHPAPPLFCLLPGLSRVASCRTSQQANNSTSVPQRADYPKLVDIQSTTFEQLMDDSVGGAVLALEIKKAEMATSDLTTLVRASDLTSRDKMAETLTGFVDGAKRTGRGLQKFSAKVAGAVDGIIAVNDYALNRIERAASASSSPSLWRAILAPFSIHSASIETLTASFNQVMSILEAELHTLILAAETSLHDLDTLEEQLKVLHAMVSREDVSLSESKQELLSRLWTMVGGNRADLRRFDSHLQLLGGLGEYRQKALAHVVGALQALQAMSADLEVLREKVSQPVLVRKDAIPLEVHVKSIRGGLERLTEGRLRTKKIEDARYAKLAEPLEN